VVRLAYIFVRQSLVEPVKNRLHKFINALVNYTVYVLLDAEVALHESVQVRQSLWNISKTLQAFLQLISGQYEF